MHVLNKILLSVSVSMIGMSATTLKTEAAVLSIFDSSGAKATIMVRGNPTDLDALELYNKIDAPVKVIDTYNVKELPLLDGSFKVLCAMSPRFTETGTCTFVALNESPINIDFKAKRFDVRLDGHFCDEVVDGFTPDGAEDTTGLLYQTRGSRLKIMAIGTGTQKHCEISFR